MHLLRQFGRGTGFKSSSKGWNKFSRQQRSVMSAGLEQHTLEAGGQRLQQVPGSDFNVSYRLVDRIRDNTNRDMQHVL
jgi:hypothetical protein